MGAQTSNYRPRPLNIGLEITLPFIGMNERSMNIKGVSCKGVRQDLKGGMQLNSSVLNVDVN